MNRYKLQMLCLRGASFCFRLEAVPLCKFMGMAGKARWVDHVIIEHWVRSLKTEEIDSNSHENPQELRIGVEEHIRKYNDERPHSAARAK
ncbi:MAG: integrase core domain-containing protein [Eubacteriales bacterium]|nr:integrase core domain-containing protein [Eubacteriales bacterium]